MDERQMVSRQVKFDIFLTPCILMDKIVWRRYTAPAVTMVTSQLWPDPTFNIRWILKNIFGF